jgi:hypothetical protein
LRKTATTFSIGDDEQAVVALEVHGDRILGVEQHAVVLLDRVVLIVVDLALIDTTRPVSVGISILSGRWMPALVCFLSSSLRISTRSPMGSTISSGWVVGLGSGMARSALRKDLTF